MHPVTAFEWFSVRTKRLSRTLLDLLNFLNKLSQKRIHQCSLLEFLVILNIMQGSIILLLPSSFRGWGKKSAQGREFKVYKESEGKKKGKDGKERKRG